MTRLQLMDPDPFYGVVENPHGSLVLYADVAPLVSMLDEAYRILKDATTTRESYWIEEMRGSIEDLLERIDQLFTDNTTKETND